MRFLSSPNLPEKKVKYVLIDYRTDTEIVEKLNEIGIVSFFSANVDSIDKAICGHTDMSIHHIGGPRFVCEPTTYDDYLHTLSLPGIELIKGFSILQRKYPLDISYNMARVADFAFHNLKYTDKEIIKNCEKNIQFVNVAQGYSKCNICIVAEKAFITEDDSIYSVASDLGIDVLKISKGDIELPGFEYGFLGGASGLVSNDLLAVTGNLKTHRDYDKILNFCLKYGVKIVSLSEKKLTDIGSIIPIGYA